MSRYKGGDYFRGAAEEIAEQAHKSIITSDLTYDNIFAKETTIAEFCRTYVDWISWGDSPNPSKLFTAGATFALVGNFGRARSCFELCLAKVATVAEREPMRKAAADYLAARAANGESVLQVARRVEAETRVAIGVEL